MKKTGSTNHVRFTVSDVPRAEAFYDPLLGFMGYELAQKSMERLEDALPRGHPTSGDPDRTKRREPTSGLEPPTCSSYE
jgi:catechol 2,3-dioxygenase-like lactoylglutathione lyase family enzyme